MSHIARTLRLLLVISFSGVEVNIGLRKHTRITWEVVPPAASWVRQEAQAVISFAATRGVLTARSYVVGGPITRNRHQSIAPVVGEMVGTVSED